MSTPKPKRAGTVSRCHFISLGCSKNRVDTEAVVGRLMDAGCVVEPDIHRADAVVINTCGFLRSAADEAMGEISAVARMKKKRPVRLVVTGCLVQRMGRRLMDEIPEIDALVGVHGYGDIVEAVCGSHARCSVRGIVIPETPSKLPRSFFESRRLTTGPAWAYLRIADGCDNRCAYCLIPGIRGRFRSRSMEDILREARLLTERGVRELNLIAQDTTNYGKDIYGRRRLAELIRRLSVLSDVRWIRVLYTHPAHYDDTLIETMAECRSVVKYLDVPIQHISDRILRAMGRGVTSSDIRRLISRLRERIPDLVLRTTMMVGFPGETETDFCRLLAFVRETGIERLGVFAYSAEEGTRAARMEGQVSEAVKKERLGRLMMAQRDVSRRVSRSRVGRSMEVLVEGKVADVPGLLRRPGYPYVGRSAGEAPEVDGKIYIRSRVPIVPGSFCRVTVDRAWTYDVGGTLGLRAGGR